MSAKGNGHNAQPLTTQHPIEQPLSEQERVAQYALAQAAMEAGLVVQSAVAGRRTSVHSRRCIALRGSIHIEHTLARLGAERLWELLQTDPYINALGA